MESRSIGKHHKLPIRLALNHARCQQGPESLSRVTRACIDDLGRAGVILAELDAVILDHLDQLLNGWEWNKEPLAWFHAFPKAVLELQAAARRAARAPDPARARARPSNRQAIVSPNDSRLVPRARSKTPPSRSVQAPTRSLAPSPQIRAAPSSPRKSRSIPVQALDPARVTRRSRLE